ncbi:MAG: hypothetical protein AAFR66_14625 [Bacteroidota bacterium]
MSDFCILASERKCQDTAIENPMKSLFTICLCLMIQLSCGQNIYKSYLQNVRQDLRKGMSLPVEDLKLIGYGALHGSAKTEEVELLLLSELGKHTDTLYYFPETDVSTAYFFQQYLSSGDPELLKELVDAYGQRVPQEKSIEMFEKWRSLHELAQKMPIQVVGIDKMASYKFAIRHLAELLAPETWTYVDSLLSLPLEEEVSYSTYPDSDIKAFVKRFLKALAQKHPQGRSGIWAKPFFEVLINNLEATLSETDRKEIIFQNYQDMGELYAWEDDLHFLRFGVGHLMKSRINGDASFLAKLIEREVYKAEEVLSIQSFLSNSEVLWGLQEDDEGNYAGYTTEAGYGISDYWLEYYKGIKSLKRMSLSDVTFFSLREEGSPYRKMNKLELIKIKRLLGRSYWEPEKDLATTDYLDAAILISDSPASRPLAELSLTSMK